MRALAVLVLAGCGRFGFGETAPVDGTTGDVPRIDATACALGGNDDDGDGLADGCDPCPYLPGTAADADGDGVGDACDPSAGKDAFTLFEPFTGNTFDPRWTRNGTITLGGSAAKLDTRGGYGYLGYTNQPGTTEVAFRGNIVEIAAGVHQFSLQFGDSTKPDSEYCEVYGDPGLALKITRLVGTQFSGIAYTDIPALAPGPYSLRFRHSAAGFWCQLETGGQTYVAQGPGDFAEPRNFTYLQFSQFLVSVDSVVEVQPAP